MFNYMLKLKKGGVKSVFTYISVLLNKWFYNVSRIFPIKKDLIVFESEGDFCDNSYALFSYMLYNGYLKKYKVVWLVENVRNFKKYKIENTVFCNKFADKLSFKRDYFLAVCGLYIYDHCMMMYGKRKGQRITYISHGASFKASKSKETLDFNNLVDEMIATGEVSGKYVSDYWKYDENRIIRLGYPRNDYFYENTLNSQKILNNYYNFDNYKKIIIWMPTFRKSRNPNISEEYFNNETDLPIFDTIEKIIQFNDYLSEKNFFVVLKVHQLSADISINKKHFSNLIILKNEDISAIGLQLYQFVACTDILITDYSSISTDYLLLDKPIIFTLDDYEEYNRSRGIFPNNAIDYMAGYHVNTSEELTDALDEIDSGVDKFTNWRAEVRKKYHDFADGKSSERIVKYLGL